MAKPHRQYIPAEGRADLAWWCDDTPIDADRVLLRIAEEFAGVLQAERRRRRMSQVEFAAVIGKHQSFVARLERPHRHGDAPSLRTMVEIFIALGMRPWFVPVAGVEARPNDASLDRAAPVVTTPLVTALCASPLHSGVDTRSAQEGANGQSGKRIEFDA